MKPEPVTLPVEHFPALSVLPGILHAFTGKVAGLDVKVDRALALERLDSHHAAARGAIGIGGRKFIVAEQVHGRDIVTVDALTASPVPNADGLITADPAVCLGIYVAAMHLLGDDEFPPADADGSAGGGVVEIEPLQCERAVHFHIETGGLAGEGVQDSRQDAERGEVFDGKSGRHGLSGTRGFLVRFPASGSANISL